MFSQRDASLRRRASAGAEPSDAERRLQSQVVAAADAADRELNAFIDAALDDLAKDDDPNGNARRRAL